MSTLGENIIPPTFPSPELSGIGEQIESAPFQESFDLFGPLVK